MKPNIKYLLSSIGLFALVFAIIRYYLFIMGKGYDASSLPKIIGLGIILIILVGIFGTMRFYFKKMRDGYADRKTHLDDELGALSLLTDEKNKHININFIGTASDAKKLRNSEKVNIEQSRFNLPVRVGDYVNFHIENDKDNISINSRIESIDSVNKIVEISISNDSNNQK